MYIVLNGRRITGRVDGLDNLEVTHTLKGSSKTPTISYASDLTLYDEAYEIVEDKIINNANGVNEKIDVEIYDECCEKVIFDGIIAGDKVDWCDGECYCTVTLSQNDDIAKKLRCFKSTLVADNKYGFQDREHPAFIYCNEIRPQFIHDMLLSFAIMLQLLTASAERIAKGSLRLIKTILKGASKIFKSIQDIFNNTVNSMINAINNIIAIVGGTPIDNISVDFKVDEIEEAVAQLEDALDDNLQNYNNKLVRIMIGCFRKHPSPLAKDYIENVCKICGLGFKSSILQDSGSIYRHLSYFNAPIKKGIFDDKEPKLIEDNIPILTGAEMLDQLKKVFNADWIIRDNTIIFERKDKIYSNSIWRDVSSLDIIDSICYSWRAEDAPAFGNFQYTDDMQDSTGSEARGLYSDVVEWNDPPSDLQEGSLEVNLPFGTPRFRNDGIDRDVITSALAGLDGASFDYIGDYDNAMIMSNGKAALPKLLLWENIYNRNRSTVKRTLLPNAYSFDGVQSAAEILTDPTQKITSVYNYPLMFNAVRNRFSNNLYEFYSMENPRVGKYKNREYELTASFECGELSDFDITKSLDFGSKFIKGLAITDPNSPPTVSSNPAVMEKVVINYSKKTIKITGRL